MARTVKLVTHLVGNEPITLCVEEFLDAYNTSRGWVSKFRIGEDRNIILEQDLILTVVELP